MQDTVLHLTGKIFFFNGRFGYIAVDGSTERAFFHHSELPAGQPPTVGESVAFTLGSYNGRVCAINVRPTSLGGAAAKGGA